MKSLIRLLLAAGLLGCLQVAAQTQPALSPNHKRDIVIHAFAHVEKAFNRKIAMQSASGVTPDARDVQDLFPTWGFAPPSNSSLTWGIQGLDSTRARVCVVIEVDDPQQWQSLILAMPAHNLSAGTADCQPAPASEVIPASYPARLTLLKTLDAQSVVKPSWLKKGDDSEITGVSPEAGVCPSVVLESSEASPSPWYRLEVRNLATDADNQTEKGKNPNSAKPDSPPGRAKKNVLRLVTLDVSPDFEATHDCNAMLPGETCSVWVRYAGQRAEALGNLQVALTNGHEQAITLLGRRQGSIKSALASNCQPLMCSSADNGSSDPACYFGVKQSPGVVFKKYKKKMR